MKQTTWHWPDHVIGKRESRRLREEHNTLANSHAELMKAIDNALESLAADYEHMCDIGTPREIDETGKIYMGARDALAKAKEVGHE